MCFAKFHFFCKWEEAEKGSTPSIDNNSEGFKMCQVPFFPFPMIVSITIPSKAIFSKVQEVCREWAVDWILRKT